MIEHRHFISEGSFTVLHLMSVDNFRESPALPNSLLTKPRGTTGEGDAVSLVIDPDSSRKVRKMYRDFEGLIKNISLKALYYINSHWSIHMICRVACKTMETFSFFFIVNMDTSLLR